MAAFTIMYAEIVSKYRIMWDGQSTCFNFVVGAKSLTVYYPNNFIKCSWNEAFKQYCTLWWHLGGLTILVLSD